MTQSQFPMNGLGFWDEIGQAVSFSVAGATPGGNLATSVTLVFAGHQVSPPVGADPAQDQVWTLVGEFRHALAAPPRLPSPPTPIPDESARRSIFGWYAQITQTL